MRKLFFVLSLFVVASLITPAFAHSGRTDWQGGHWDRSSGEYHFHHGYGPHNHYDMDGDGDIDCPYEFDSRIIGVTSTSEAYDRGYAVGKEKGYDIGYDEGFEYGNERGYKKGFEDGRADALANDIQSKVNMAIIETFFVTLMLYHSLIKPIWDEIISELDDRKKRKSANHAHQSKNRFVFNTIETNISNFLHTPFGFSIAFVGLAIGFIVWAYFSGL